MVRTLVVTAQGGDPGPGPGGRLEGPVHDGDADLRRPAGARSRPDHPRPQGHPAERQLRDGALRRQAVPDRARRLPRPRAPEQRHLGQRRREARARSSTTRASPARRSTSTRRCATASSSRTARCPRRASPRPPSPTTRPASTSRRRIAPTRRTPPAAARRSPRRRRRSARRRSTRASRTAGTSCPATTEYYGGDFPVFTVDRRSRIDSACGPLGKSVFDAAQIADPEIDYNQFDSDKDGVVDFFMLVFVGCGGNGASQLRPCTASTSATGPPYDNIWPHSSSLEATVHATRRPASPATSATTS